VIFSTVFSETCLVLRTERGMIKNVYWSSCKVPVTRIRFNETLIFWIDFRIILKYQIFMKIRPVGAELFHADGRTDRHEDANSRFSQFCERA
jgi:hypothetical protein